MKATEHSLAGHVKEFAAERASAKVREVAVATAAPERARLASTVQEIDRALDTTRPERVVAIATGLDPTEPVVQALGPLPETRGGQRVWCGLATQIERDRDRGVWRDPIDHAGRHTTLVRAHDTGGADEWTDGLIRLGEQADPVPASVVAEPDAWERQLEVARDVRHLAVEVGLDHGLGL